ncbi:MAG: hypothetical protein AAB426_04895, partial [Myxococcota bacterium]
AGGRLVVRIKTKRAKCDPKAPHANPDWLSTVSALKLRTLWRSRDRIYYHTYDIRAHIKIYGVDRFFSEHREEILFGDDIHNDRQALLATLAADERRANNLALWRLFLRHRAERRSIRISEPPSIVGVEYTVRAVERHRVFLGSTNDAPFHEFKYAIHKTLRKQSMRHGKTTWTIHLLCHADLARCQRLDAIDATVVGALCEAKHALRVRGTDLEYVPPPIAHFVTHPLYDKNVWGLITKFI